MPYQSELLFLKKILEKHRIKCHSILASEHLFPEFDLGLRRFLYGDTIYISLCSKIASYAQKNTLFRFQDEYLCNYYLLSLPGQAESPALFIGPFTDYEITTSMVLELMERLQLDSSYCTQFKKYYSTLPLISDETWLLSVLTTFCELIWSDLKNFHVENIRHSLSDALIPITIRPDFFESEETIIAMKTMEDRYKIENDFIDAVAHGLSHKAMTLTSDTSFFSMEKRLSDPVRDIKNYNIVLNILLRKAAEAGGVHPFHLDSLSSKYSRKIELITSCHAGRSLQKEMIHKYCLLVKNHSVKGYSLLIQKVLTRIDTDLTADLSLHTHSELLNVNASYLSSLFKKEVGMTLTEYVTKKRIEYAIFLLNSTHLQIQTVAQSCGMPDVNYFTKTFKKLVGKTPKEYRQSIS